MSDMVGKLLVVLLGTLEKGEIMSWRTSERSLCWHRLGTRCCCWSVEVADTTTAEETRGYFM